MGTHLVLKIHGGVEMGDLGVDALADHLALAGVHELAHLEDGGGRAHVSLLEAAAAWIAINQSVAARREGRAWTVPARPREESGIWLTSTATTTTEAATAAAASTAAKRHGGQG